MEMDNWMIFPNLVFGKRKNKERKKNMGKRGTGTSYHIPILDKNIWTIKVGVGPHILRKKIKKLRRGRI